MLVEALTKLQSLIEDARRTTIHKLPGDAPGRRMLIKPDGSIDFVLAEPHPRTLTTDNVDEIPRVALEHFDGEVAKENRMLIVYNASGATLIFDHHNAAETMSFTPRHTFEDAWFSELADHARDGVTFDVAQAVALFDLPLRRTMPDPTFIHSIAKLKRLTEESRQAEHDATSSLVGGITSKKIDDASLPAQTAHKFTVRPFGEEQLSRRLPVEVLIRADLEQMVWRFFVVPDSWTTYREGAAEMIGDRIRAKLGDAPIPVIRARMSQPQPTE